MTMHEYVDYEVKRLGLDVVRPPSDRGLWPVIVAPKDCPWKVELTPPMLEITNCRSWEQCHKVSTDSYSERPDDKIPTLLRIVKENRLAMSPPCMSRVLCIVEMGLNLRDENVCYYGRRKARAFDELIFLARGYLEEEEIVEILGPRKSHNLSRPRWPRSL